MPISLDQANALISATLYEGLTLGLKPLTVVVTCPGGHMIALARQDGASNLRPQLALAKASGALDLGMSSRKIADMAAERQGFVLAVGEISHAGVIPAAGGLLIADPSGTLIGAVGVTGDTSDNDEAAALAGLATVGLKAL